MKVVWTIAARKSLVVIHNFIAIKNQHAAKRIVRQLRQVTDRRSKGHTAISKHEQQGRLFRARFKRSRRLPSCQTAFETCGFADANFTTQFSVVHGNESVASGHTA